MLLKQLFTESQEDTDARLTDLERDNRRATERLKKLVTLLQAVRNDWCSTPERCTGCGASCQYPGRFVYGVLAILLEGRLDGGISEIHGYY